MLYFRWLDREIYHIVQGTIRLEEPTKATDNVSTWERWRSWRQPPSRKPVCGDGQGHRDRGLFGRQDLARARPCTTPLAQLQTVE
ncbi:hypothetical protein CN140_31735 [Sinorhizobium meliloti]|nr:hypothetical protein CN140_31735 [Sinorhizobium meliloti]